MEDPQIPQTKENIWNIPNTLTFSRIIITFLTIFLIFGGYSIVYIVTAFVIGMITDCLDGQIARRFKMTTEFGRQFDMIADRVLMIGVALAAIIKLGDAGIFSSSQLFQVFLILTREIVASSVVFLTIISGKGVLTPHVSFVGKATTVMQAITFPLILLNTVYLFFSFSIYFAIATAIIGGISAFMYVNDVKNMLTSKR